MKLAVGMKRILKRKSCGNGGGVKRWDVAKLQGRSVDEEGTKTDQRRFLDYAEEKLGEYTIPTNSSISHP